MYAVIHIQNTCLPGCNSFPSYQILLYDLHSLLYFSHSINLDNKLRFFAAESGYGRLLCDFRHIALLLYDMYASDVIRDGCSSYKVELFVLKLLRL